MVLIFCFLHISLYLCSVFENIGYAKYNRQVTKLVFYKELTAILVHPSV